MKYWLKVIFTPTCWFAVGRFSLEWDRKLNQLMQEHTFEQIDEYTAKLGEYCVWLKNHPYASFATYTFGDKGPIPRRRTMFAAMEKYDRDVLS